MFRGVANAALALLLAGVPVYAEVASPDVEPRSYLSPTDEIEPAPRIPPVTQPKPMERTRLGQPADAAPAERTTPSPKRATPAARHATEPRRVMVQRRATAPRRMARKHTAASARRVARAPSSPDTSLSTIFTQPRYDARTPPNTLAPRSGPTGGDPATRRAMTYNYAPVLPATAPPAFGGAPCPTRSRTSLAALFACTR